MEPVGLRNQQADEDEKARMPSPSEDQMDWSLKLTAKRVMGRGMKTADEFSAWATSSL